MTYSQIEQACNIQQKIIDASLTKEERFRQLVDGLTFHPTKDGYVYKRDTQWIFALNKTNNFWVNYSNFWKIFEAEYGMKYIEIKDFVEYQMLETMKRKVSTPPLVTSNLPLTMLETMKRKVSTPVCRNFRRIAGWWRPLNAR